MGGSDAERVRRAQQGDVEAFAELVEGHWARLVAFARSVVGDAEAEDAVQDGFVIAWDRLAQVRVPEAFAAWMMRTLARSCIRRARRRGALVPLDSVAEPAQPGAGNPTEVIDVERVLAVLAPRQRAVMHMTVIEGMSDSEIGAVLGIDPGSVRSHRRRARERLRAVLQPATRGR